MSFSERISPLLGRLAIAWFFLSEAWAILQSWDGTVVMMQMKHVELAAPLLVLAVAAMVLGGLSVALGYHTRHGALMLFGFTVIASIVMHDYWKIASASERAADYEIFVRNMAIAGGLLLLMGIGPGPFAIDNQPAGKRR
jgi:putative oxidoreductase